MIMKYSPANRQLSRTFLNEVLPIESGVSPANLGFFSNGAVGIG